MLVILKRPIDLFKTSKIKIFNIHLVVITHLLAQFRALFRSLASMMYIGYFASQSIVDTIDN